MLCGGKFCEWNSGSSYALRLAHLTATTAGGQNATTYLKGPGAGQTVFDDSIKDTLTGSNNQDWFFVKTSGGTADSITDKANNETATAL